jgi:ABC-type lipoprotein export system ATPase subunit
MRLELAGVTKRFGTLVANDHVSLTVEPGEIHCLLGENGAGKSTLMNVVFGMLRPDEGEVLVDGEVFRPSDSGEAVRRGIGMVHQHFMLVPVFTVAENVVLGFEPTRRTGILDRRRARSEIARLSEEFGLEVDPDATVESLPVGVQQRVEILKALHRDAPLFLVGALAMARHPSSRDGDGPRDAGAPPEATGSAARIAATTFAVVALAEVGDLTQVLVADLAARDGHALSVFAGASVAFVLLSAAGALAGRTLARVVPLVLVRRISAAMLAALAIWSALGAAGA